MGARIQNIVRELGNERVDIIEWSKKPQAFITNALSPAKVSTVVLNTDAMSAKVIVPEKELSLAIGKEGQNVRLAVKLTGWKIDIMSEEEAEIGKKKQKAKEKEKTDDKKAKAAALNKALEEQEESSVKVHELAKELGLKSNEVIEKLKELGHEVKAANSSVSEEAVKALKENIS